MSSDKIIFETKSGPTKVTVKNVDGVQKLVLNGTYVHSILNNKQLITSEDYWDYLLLSRLFLKHDPLNICVLGLGGGTIVHLFEHYFQPAQVNAVEIDPIIARVSKKYFDLNYKNLNIYVEDARAFIKKTKQKYDLIVVDVFNPEGQEESCNTVEFYADVKNRLTREGMVAVNHFDTTSKEALVKTFDHIYSVPIHLNVVHFCTTLDLTPTELATRLAIFTKTNPDFEVFKTIKTNKIV